MKPDIILQWCVYCDYPLYRAWVKKYRDKFNKVILYPSRHHGFIDLENFAKESFPETWVDPVEIDYGTQDWRQAEVEPCLSHVESDWIFFSEQDFFVKDWDKFFEDIEKAKADGADVIGLWNPTHFPYIHPSCFLIKRELFEKTNKDFSAHPEINGADHFSMLTRDAERLGAKIVTLQDLGYKEWEDMFHLGGLTYIYQDWKDDKSVHFGVKNVPAFYAYNEVSRKAPVEQDNHYFSLSILIEEEIKRRFPGIEEESKKWRKFFV